MSQRNINLLNSHYLTPRFFDMKKIRVLIVDDEIAQQEIMLRALSQRDDTEIVGVASNVEQGLAALYELNPQLVFLDIDLGSQTGFDLLNHAEKRNFEVIFCTSHSEFALQAFKVSAIDYLLKPIDGDELEMAIKKYISRVATPDIENTSLVNLLSNLQLPIKQQKLALPTSTGLIFVKTEDIMHIESNNALTVFFLSDSQQIVVSRTMKDCEEMLVQKGFCRIHQSHLINLQHVKRYIKGEGGQVIMEDGSALEVSRRKKEEFLSALQRI